MNNFRKYLIEDKICEFPVSLIKEGLIQSWEYDKILSILEKKFNVKCNLTDFCLEIIFDRADITKDITDNLTQILNLSGYYISNYYIDNNKEKGSLSLKEWFSNYNQIKLQLNKKFDSDSNGIPLKMYHVTKKENIDRIKKQGLKPVSNSKIEKHPDRIYLFDNIESASYYKNDLIEMYNLNDIDVIILEIDTRLINKIKLYEDPKFCGENWGAYYTYSNISPFSIITEI